MKVGIATDHRGYELKKELINRLNNYEIIDYGTYSQESVDYPNFAFKVGEAITNKEIDFGILLCGTGIGMSIAANKVKGVRCAKVDNVDEAKITRIDNNSNIIALSSKKDISELLEMINVFLNQPFTKEERHQRRINLIDNYES